MKALLMHPDRSFDAKRKLPAHTSIVRQDLALDIVLQAMAGDDKFIAGIACSALLNAPDNDMQTVLWRQAVLADTIAHPQPVREMYAIVVAALDERRKNAWIFHSRFVSSILSSSVHALRMFSGKLHTLRTIAQAHAAEYQADGLCNLFAMLQREFDDAYLARVRAHLDEMELRHGALMSAQLGPNGESRDYVLRRPRDSHWWQRLLGVGHISSKYTVRIAPRDMAGGRALGEMRDRGIEKAANALAQSTEHIVGFFEMLRAELAFYVGCANLYERLAGKHVPTCFPTPRSMDADGMEAKSLRDVALVLSMDREVVANTVDAVGKPLIIVTGANQGGKSTFLRSCGLAQLMLQSGMFVAAEAFCAPLCTGVFTHYKREEDMTMRGGKLDEELARISTIADAIHPGALLLCNESFASTNEREGSEIARQITEAMVERGVRVISVTHLYTFAQGMLERHRDDALFLRTERLPDGTRTFHLRAGMPQATGFGQDLYRDIFHDDESTQAKQVVAAVAGRGFH